MMNSSTIFAAIATNSTKKPAPVYPLSDQVGALAGVVLLAGCCGAAVSMLPGYQFPKIWKFPGYKTPTIMKVITIPPLLGMIIMGFIARNYLGDIMKAYPTVWAGYIRSICISMILTRGGLGI